MDYIPITVKDGVRWDTVSQEAYGRPDLFPGILAANPDVPFSPRIAGGTVLQVPVLPAVEATPDASLLPPWKR